MLLHPQEHQTVEDQMCSHAPDVSSGTLQQVLRLPATGRASTLGPPSEFFAVVVKQVSNESFASSTSVGGTQESQR